MDASLPNTVMFIRLAAPLKLNVFTGLQFIIGLIWKKEKDVMFVFLMILMHSYYNI